ncbi:MAG: aerobic carbon-monoxide dehydrogenase medium subunit [Thermoleophilaceae bacterium]|jgi:carbon-monoxide dehydrogenase medium subunit|nr:aerobic carbon-monoxide dehydrogenase medium subunit [Thermoleophilaceae bacterium]
MQVPAPFEYERATSVDNALALLERLGPEARIVAGGHSLLPMMKLRLAVPEYLVDINDLDELDYVHEDSGGLAIGAMSRHRTLLEHDGLAARFPIFRDAESVIADPPVRNRGTIGGALCQADPAEDLSAVCAACHAQLVIQGTSGRRTVEMSDFHTGPYETAVGDAEMLVEIRLPLLANAGSAYEKVERRRGDWAVASVGSALWLGDDGRVAEVGIGLASLGTHVLRATAAEDGLRGQEPSDEAIETAATAVAEATDPVTDQRGTAAYKRHLAAELTRRSLRRALARIHASEEV